MQDRVNWCYRSFVLAVPLIVSLVPVSTIGQQRSDEKKQRIANKQYGFSFECPKSWSVDSGYIADPLPDLEAFKTGTVGLEGTLGKLAQGEKNGVRLNAIKPVGDGETLAPPTIEIYAHSSPEKSCDQFAVELKQWQAMFGQKLVSANTITTSNKLEGCDVVYTTHIGPQQVFSRMTVFFVNGRRYILTYFEPNEADFRANAKAFEDVLRSLIITK